MTFMGGVVFGFIVGTAFGISVIRFLDALIKWQTERKNDREQVRWYLRELRRARRRGRGFRQSRRGRLGDPVQFVHHEAHRAQAGTHGQVRHLRAIEAQSPDQRPGGVH